MKIKHLLIFLSFSALFLISCEKKMENLDPYSINTVYWDIPKLKDTLSVNNIVLTGEVGNNKGVDSLHVQITDISHNKILYNGTIQNSGLTSENRTDYPSSVTKWYKINFKPPVSFTSNSYIQFTLVAHTPFGVGQDLRSKSTNSVLIQ